MKANRLGVVLALSGAFVAATAVSASAWVRKSGTFSQGTTGVTCTSGTYEFRQNEAGDFWYQCYLKDTSADGNSVFVHGKVAGYGYGPRLYHSGGNGTGAWKSQFLDDPAATYVSYANVQSCQDRGIWSDLCDSDSFSS